MSAYLSLIIESTKASCPTIKNIALRLILQFILIVQLQQLYKLKKICLLFLFKRVTGCMQRALIRPNFYENYKRRNTEEITSKNGVKIEK